MAVLTGVSEQRRGQGNYFQACLNQNLLQACRPSPAKGETIIRIIPQVSADGDILPMVNQITPNGPDFSNIQLEQMTIHQGLHARYSGLGRSLDNEDDPVDMLYPGMFIRLRKRMKDHKVPAELMPLVDQLFEGEDKRDHALRSPPVMGLAQCAVYKFNNEELAEPRTRQVCFLTVTAVEALNELLTECHQEGIDAFAPSTGRLIKLVPEKQRGSNMVFFGVELGEEEPLDEDTCRELWVPWENGLIVRPRRDHYQAACRGFSKALVDYLFPGDAERFGETDAVEPSMPLEEPDTPAPAPTADSPAAPAKKKPRKLSINMETPPLDGDEADEERPAKKAVETVTPDPDDPEATAARYKDLLDDDE